MPEVAEGVLYRDHYFITTGCRRHGMGNQVFAGIIRGLPETESSIAAMGCYEDGGIYSIPQEALSDIDISVDTLVDNQDSRDVEDLVRLLHGRVRTDSQVFEVKWNKVSKAWEATELGLGDDIELKEWQV